MANESEYIEVATATTNTTEGSNIDVHIIKDKPPICPNMTDSQFRELVMRCRDGALTLIEERQLQLDKWSKEERDRAKKWLGRSDENIRSILMRGLPKLHSAMSELKPENIFRFSEDAQHNVSCIPVANYQNTEASVCKPDSARRQISIYPKFCTLPDANLFENCKIKALIHECTHYTDVFDSEDLVYATSSLGLAIWVRNNQDRAFRNADSITAYISHDEARRLWWSRIYE